MSNDDFKKILDQSLKPLQVGLEEVRMSLSEVKKELKIGLGEVMIGLEAVKKEVKEVRDVQEKRVLPSLTYIETTVKSYADSYVANEDHIRRLDKRLNKVEDNLGIFVPEDLSIPPAK